MAEFVSPSLSVSAPIQTLEPVLARQVITQIITYPDYTTTAVVTLGPGDATPVPGPTTPPTVSSGDSNGITSSDIGIIIGSILGAVALGLLIWMFVVIRRRMIAFEYKDDDDIIYTYDEVTEIQQPRRVWQFPWSIPPPIVPTYVATPRLGRVTSHDVPRGVSYVNYNVRD